jgi:hypothetical protein
VQPGQVFCLKSFVYGMAKAIGKLSDRSQGWSKVTHKLCAPVPVVQPDVVSVRSAVKDELNWSAGIKRRVQSDSTRSNVRLKCLERPS